MPTLLRFRLRLLEKAVLRPRNAPAQGWLLALLAAFDGYVGNNSDWAGEMHSTSTGSTPRRAYTTSPPYPCDGFTPLFEENDPYPIFEADENGRTLLPAGMEIAIRIAVADDVRAALLWSALPQLPLPHFCGARYELLSNPDELDTQNRLCVSWERLADAPPYQRLRLVFASPTAFMSQGDILPRPEPERFWASWQRTWQDLAPFVPDGTEVLQECLPRIAAFELCTRPISTKGGLFIGFTGWMELSWRPGTPERIRRAAASVASVSDFFGTGAKTAMGMGQTRCLFR